MRVKKEKKCGSLGTCDNWDKLGKNWCEDCWKEYWEARIDEEVTEDGRTSSQRDFARVIHSAAFRRLQAKTQVLGLGDSDFYRTRLTHSLEVSQIGEGIMRQLEGSDDVPEQIKEILPDSAQIRAICLAHDLGHPPFGHGGERALNKVMLNNGGFEGNGQSLRILASLPTYHEKHGMNLNRRTLLGVLKYPAPYCRVVNPDLYPKEEDYSKVSGKRFKPPKCYFKDEEDTIEWIREKLEKDWDKVSAPSRKNPNEHSKAEHMSLDAKIMEMADDIAYGTHDLEDAITLKLVTESDFRETVAEADIEPFIRYQRSLDKPLYEDYNSLVGHLFGDETRLRKRAFGNLVGFFICTTEVCYKYKFKNPIFCVQVKFGNNSKDVLDKLEEVVREKVINSRTVQQLEFKGKKIITELFEAFICDPENLLPRKQAKLYEEKKSDNEKMRVICDYIAGMTDDYAIRRYEQMFVPGVGSVFDFLG